MFGSDWIRVSDQIRLNPYSFKKIEFYPYPYPYPLSNQRIFLLFDRSDRVENPRIRTHFPSLHMTNLGQCTVWVTIYGQCKKKKSTKMTLGI